MKSNIELNVIFLNSTQLIGIIKISSTNYSNLAWICPAWMVTDLFIHSSAVYQEEIGS